MNKCLDSIRNVESKIPANRKIINTVLILCLGIALGTFSKFLDFRQAELRGILMSVDRALDFHNFLGRFAIWVLLAVCISVYSNSSVRAGINVFAFFTGMVTSYYLYSNYIAGFFPKSYAIIWFGFTAVSPFLAFVCWYAKGTGRLAFALSVVIEAVLFNMTFVYGWGYLEPRSILECVVFVIGCMVLKRNTLKGTVLVGLFGIVLAFLLDVMVPFQFG